MFTLKTFFICQNIFQNIFYSSDKLLIYSLNDKGEYYISSNIRRTHIYLRTYRNLAIFCCFIRLYYVQIKIKTRHYFFNAKAAATFS